MTNGQLRLLQNSDGHNENSDGDLEANENESVEVSRIRFENQSWVLSVTSDQRAPDSDAQSLARECGVRLNSSCFPFRAAKRTQANSLGENYFCSILLGSLRTILENETSNLTDQFFENRSTHPTFLHDSIRRENFTRSDHLNLKLTAKSSIAKTMAPVICCSFLHRLWPRQRYDVNGNW